MSGKEALKMNLKDAVEKIQPLQDEAMEQYCKTAAQPW